MRTLVFRSLRAVAAVLLAVLAAGGFIVHCAVEAWERAVA